VSYQRGSTSLRILMRTLRSYVRLSIPVRTPVSAGWNGDRWVDYECVLIKRGGIRWHTVLMGNSYYTPAIEMI